MALSFVSPHVQLLLPGWTTERGDAAIDYVVQIDGLTTFGSDLEAVNPETGPYDRFTDLMGKVVTVLDAAEDGTLRLEFDSGQGLTIPPDDYEPWQVWGSDGSGVVSAAGGGLTEFASGNSAVRQPS